MIGCIVVLVAGILCSRFFLSEAAILFIQNYYEILLYVLLICVGISVGSNMDKYGLKKPQVAFLFLPLITIFATLLGGIICGLILGYPIKLSLAVASGLSFSSVSGVLITDSFGANAGALAFLSNLARELLSFVFVPLVSKKMNIYASISLCASTAGDTLLPVITKQSNEYALPAVYNGVVCTVLAPALTKLFISI